MSTVQESGQSVSSSAIKRAISREEMSRHCQRRTCGKVETQVIEELFLDMVECTDLGGYPLFDNRIVSICEEERKHVWCLQDPEGVALHTVTGHITKGD